MTTFAVAYLAVWLAVVLYALGLGLRQRRLERDLQALQSQLRETEDAADPTPKAA